MGKSFLGENASRRFGSKHITISSTINSTTTGDHHSFPLMPLNPLAPVFLLHDQLLSDSPITLNHPSTMNLPLAQIFCGMPSPFVLPPTLYIPQPLHDGVNLPFISQKNPSKQDPESTQLLPEPSTLFLSPLHFQIQCLHAIQKSIKQVLQHLMAKHLDRKPLQIFAIKFRNDFAALCYLLFHSVGNNSPER